MIPRARSDQLFWKNGGMASQRTEEEETREELFGPDSGEGEEDSSVAIRSRSSLSRGSSIKKRQPANKERSRRRNRVQYPEDNQFNKLTNMMIERNTIQKAEEESNESKELKDAMKVTQLSLIDVGQQTSANLLQKLGLTATAKVRPNNYCKS